MSLSSTLTLRTLVLPWVLYVASMPQDLHDQLSVIEHLSNELQAKVEPLPPVPAASGRITSSRIRWFALPIAPYCRRRPPIRTSPCCSGTARSLIGVPHKHTLPLADLRLSRGHSIVSLATSFRFLRREQAGKLKPTALCHWECAGLQSSLNGAGSCSIAMHRRRNDFGA